MRVTVRSGDTFWYYSQLFDIPHRLVVDSNPGIDPTQLSVGSTVAIPGYITNQYTVSSGDTFWSLANERGLPLDAIYILNPYINPNNLQPGQVINIPVRVTWMMVEGKRNYDYEGMMTEISHLLDVYPFVREQIIGQSVMGKPIPELRVGVGEKRVHANGSFHAQEWITTPVLMTFLNEYLLSLTNETPIRGLEMSPFYEETMFSLVPMVNPDGVNLVLHGAPEEEPYRTMVLSLNQGNEDFDHWKANIRGVDLNNQFPAMWEEEATVKPSEPAPRDYPGERPLTEPEAIAMANLTIQSDFDRVLAFHTQGKVIFWGYQGLEPPQSRVIVEEFERVSGYEPIQYVESFAGYKDWFIQEWQRPGYTVELGLGVNPLPLDQFEEIYEESLGILLASLYM